MARTTTPESRVFSRGFTWTLLFGVTLNPINSSIIATALVSIADDLGVTAVQTALLVSALYLVSAICQPLMGRLATRYGARSVFMSGIVLVGIGGAVGWVTPNISWLVVSRLIIGLGTSAAYPTAMMMINLKAEAAEVPLPSRILSLVAAAGQVTAAIGLPLGGALVAGFGWRSVFVINVPLAVVSLIATLVFVPRGALDRRDRSASFTQHMDPVGILLFAGLMTALLGFLSDLADPRWWLLAVFAGVALALAYWERRQRSPLVDVRMLARNGALRRTYVRLIMTFTVMYGALYGVGQWLEEARGVDPGGIGLLMLPMSVMSAVVALMLGKSHSIRLMLVGTAVFVVAGGGFLWLSGAQDRLVWPVIAMAFLGVAMGLGNVGNQAMLYLKSTPDQIGVNSGFYRTASYIGGFIATGLIGATFPDGATDGGIILFAIVFAALGAALLLISLADPRIPRTSLTAETPAEPVQN
ncbi:MFS transporter [Streptomyces sp. AC512_CC834]|uniref:MFS transporter n=1 Tax=Streptomyces sp. AC512_CC834 TaxID=2823691 RepID=UPI001C25B099|nr:MFS transporter [Streptomyces sp. AC512_CC834]